LFGFWAVEQIINGRVSPPREIELSFYLGWIGFYALGLLLAFSLLLFRGQDRPGAFLKAVLMGIVTTFVTLACLAASALLWRGIASRYEAVGWDPVSAVRATPAWRVVPAMLLVFAVSFTWRLRRLHTAAP
jgi:hypothetical protein